MSTNVANPVLSLRPGPAARGIWSRAAVLGSLWAAFEIVAGSFLHNLRIPLAGTLLAGMGVVLMLSTVQVWHDRGLVWRAALICALMKSISPSAVILGPMIGIAAEGFVLQLVLAALGRGWVSCIIAGALAVSWTLAQKILGLLIIYGPDFVSLYAGTVNYAAKATGWNGLEPASLIWSLLAVQATAGAAAGFAGWRLGNRISLSPAAENALAPRPAADPARPRVERPQQSFTGHSLPVLILLAAILFCGLWAMSSIRLAASAALSIGVSTALFLRYRQGLGKLRRPRFWLELLGVLLLSGLLLGGLTGGAGSSWKVGFNAGAAMALRAIFVVVMFSAISIELRNPRIVAWLSRGRFADASAALGAAFESLPDFIASMPALSIALRDPGKGLAALFQLAHAWEERFSADSPAARIILITGERGSGKTSLLTETVGLLHKQGRSAGGILSPGFWQESVRTGYDVVDAATGQRHPLARRSSQPAPGQRCAFTFDEGGFAEGRRALERARHVERSILFVDEVGPVEMEGGGWADQLDWIRRRHDGVAVWVVRPSLVEAVRQRWDLPESAVLEASAMKPAGLAALLCQEADAAAGPLCAIL
jgi:nucleoside-triphosphatase THEP1